MSDGKRAGDTPLTDSQAYADWGWLNGLTETEMAVWRAECERHQQAMEDGTGEHRCLRNVSNGRTEDHKCSCGFGWKADSSG